MTPAIIAGAHLARELAGLIRDAHVANDQGVVLNVTQGLQEIPGQAGNDERK